MKYTIYVIENIINHKRYVGQTSDAVGVEKRFRQHVYQATHENEYTYNFYLHRAIRKYGEENFVCKTLIHGIDEYKVDFYEQLWISKLNTYCKTGFGYNMTKGGQGVHGVVFSEESRKKMSDKGKAYWKDIKENNPERYQQLCQIRSESKKGKKRPQEFKQRMSEIAKQRTGKRNSFYGKHHSEQTKQKISEANSKPVRMLSKDGRPLKDFPSVVSAQNYLISIGATTNKSAHARILVVCKKVPGQGVIAYGYRWEFI